MGRKVVNARALDVVAGKSSELSLNEKILMESYWLLLSLIFPFLAFLSSMSERLHKFVGEPTAYVIRYYLYPLKGF